jgi:hypothetical protein
MVPPVSTAHYSASHLGSSASSKSAVQAARRADHLCVPMHGPHSRYAAGRGRPLKRNTPAFSFGARLDFPLPAS